MAGQDAVNAARAFDSALALTGVILTKADGDARGGAALSVRQVTGKPILFLGTGEKTDALEPFHPERIAGRILGMGDVLSLIERAEQAVDRERALALAGRLRRSEFTLEDFREQLQQVRKLGPLDQVLAMLPGAASIKGIDSEAGEREMKRSLAIIDSMTPGERRDPSLMNGSRRKRIARGSGTSVEDVNRLLKQYVQARKLMKGLAGGGGALKKLAARLAPAGRVH